MEPLKVKQVIVMRRGLGMRRGKEIAQGAHASVSFLTIRVRKGRAIATRLLWRILSLPLRLAGFRPIHLPLTKAEVEWIEGSFSKICTQVQTEQELIDICVEAGKAGLQSRIILDNGATEFNGVKTNTCVAIGPDYAEKVDAITGKLKLY